MLLCRLLHAAIVVLLCARTSIIRAMCVAAVSTVWLYSSHMLASRDDSQEGLDPIGIFFRSHTSHSRNHVSLPAGVRNNTTVSASGIPRRVEEP